MVHRLDYCFPQPIACLLHRQRVPRCFACDRLEVFVGAHFRRLLDSITNAHANLQLFIEYQRTFMLIDATCSKIHFMFDQFDDGIAII